MHRTRILILGGGFGGIYAALEMEKHLARRPNVEVTLITRDNFFLFTPMLHEVAAGDPELSTIVNPLRELLRRVNTFVGTVEAIDLDARLLIPPSVSTPAKLPPATEVRVALDWTLDLCFAKDFACTASGPAAAGTGVRVEIAAPGRALAGAGAS
jgi:hypothetical protein